MDAVLPIKWPNYQLIQSVAIGFLRYGRRRQLVLSVHGIGNQLLIT